MRSINADRFTTVFENSDVIPHDLVISKAWPAAVLLELMTINTIKDQMVGGQY